MLVCDFGLFCEGFIEGKVWEEKFRIEDTIHLVDGFGELGDFLSEFGELGFAMARFLGASLFVCP